MRNFDLEKIDDIFMDLERKVENMFERLFQQRGFSLFGTETAWRPPLEIYETGKNIIIKMEIPGMQPKDFSIYFQDNILTIHGRRQDIYKSQGVNYYCMEINYGVFERKIMFNQPVNKNKLSTNYKDGFLEVVVNKLGDQNVSLSVNVF